MTRKYQQTGHREGSTYQPKHLLAMSDKEVFFLKSVMTGVLRGALKNQQKVNIDLEKESGRHAMRLIDALHDFTNDILGIPPHGPTTQRSNNLRQRWESIADDRDDDSQSGE